jgi:pseudaminic acid cytidylyltransferase
MLAWTIDVCANSGCFDSIVVTTDDDEIAQVARDAGASAPFVRAADLSDDVTPLRSVVADVVDRLVLTDDTLVCCVYATAVGMTSDDLRGS